MRDPYSWSFPLVPLFGVAVRVHFLLPFLMLAMVLRQGQIDSVSGSWQDMAWVQGLLFVAILCHEFGHVFAARRMDGDANEVMLWPLGGLARCDIPHTPKAHFVTALGGPLVNFGLCALCALVLGFVFDEHYQPPWNPFEYLLRVLPTGEIALRTWNGGLLTEGRLGVKLVVWFFWLNWSLMLLNLVLVGFPFDAGRLLQAALWPSFGYRQATFYAIYSGFFVMVVLLVVSMAFNEVLVLMLAWFTYSACQHEWLVLETGGEDSVFGYDFSQGYTSLEKDEAARPRRRRRQNFFQRWLQRRALRKMQLEQERELADTARMDELLDKIHRYGKQSLTDEEQRFMKRFSERYKNKPI